MPTSGSTLNANAIVVPGAHVDRFLRLPSVSALLIDTHVNWQYGTLMSAPPTVINLLHKIEGIEPDGKTLTSTALKLLGRLQVDLIAAAHSSTITERFEISDPLAEGATSIALKATNKAINRTVVLKILRPLPEQQAAGAVQQLGTVENITGLIAPIDAYTIPTKSCSGDPLLLYCIVFPYINAITLDSYLNKRPPLTPFFFEQFIRQVGGVLDQLQERGLEHGDLHGNNILVSSESPTLEFAIIDPSPGLTSPSRYSSRGSDFEWFKEHLARALYVLQRLLPSISMQKDLGPRLFAAINGILQSDLLSFKEVRRCLDANRVYEQWLRRRSAFIEDKFRQPKPLGLLRWEEISDPAQAVELFQPYEELFKRVRAFGNSLLVGARGSGKSTYLAALAYFPGAQKRLVDPQETFGILFSCRQGEFKQLSQEFITLDADARVGVKHVLILKIMRRTLATLTAACEREEVDVERDLTDLYDFVERYMARGSSIARVTSEPAVTLANLTAGLVRWEEVEIRRLFSREQRTPRLASPQLDESALLEFCRLIQRHCSTLASAQFYFLFDDAGEPNIPAETQRILNDLVTNSNPVYCIKLSAERYSYDRQNSTGRTLQETHDVSSFDIASAYATEGGLDESRAAVKGYFAQIMRRRLEQWHYPSTEIAHYLGDQMSEKSELMPIRELIRKLAAGSKDAYYAGWEVVWRLADKTPRNLLELVSEIFANAGVRPLKEGAASTRGLADMISPKVQDRAIRAVSNRRLRSLEFTPGEISIHGTKVPLGRHLYLCATSFGLVSRRYLVAYRPENRNRRFEERLAIEQNDSSALRREARSVLELLVRYGVYDDSGLTVAFDDNQKKPIYVFNRILCPAFSISFRRDSHLRLSAKKFELYLLEPTSFAREGTAFLKSGRNAKDEPSLFREG